MFIILSKKRGRKTVAAFLLIIRVAIDFGPTMQLRGKKEEKHPRKKREFLDGEWNPKIPQPVCVYTCTHTTALRLQKMHIAVIKSNSVSIIDGYKLMLNENHVFLIRFRFKQFYIVQILKYI